MSPKSVPTEVDGRKLTLSNLEKVLYPDSGFTKGEVLDYYARVADIMLPHVQDRPVTLRRYPNGVDGMSFFEKHAPAHLPEWVCTTTVPSRSGADDIEFAVICDRPTLLWAANLASLEFHVPLWRVVSRKKSPTPPDYMVFDLDPGPGTSIVECCRVAQWIVEVLGREHIYPKTSGSKGLQLYRPLTKTSWAESGQTAHELAQRFERDHPDDVVSTMRKNLRDHKVLIDWSQNNPSKTTVAAYSLRARPEPTVSTPVTWDEVDRCVKKGDASLLRFTTSDVLDRIDAHGDLMAPLLDTLKKSAPSRRKRDV